MAKVTVYSLTGCSECAKAKRFLKDNNIEFSEVNLSENKDKMKELVEKTGARSAPIIEIDGEFVLGFDEAKLKEKLGL